MQQFGIAWQVPLKQVWQVPQAPQLPPQPSGPQVLPAQAGVQPQAPGVPPPPQVCGGWQLTPQAPQLGLAFLETQLPPQQIWPAPQAVLFAAATQLPPEQVWQGPQAVQAPPLPPQAALSLTWQVPFLQQPLGQVLALHAGAVETQVRVESWQVVPGGQAALQVASAVLVVSQQALPGQVAAH